MSRPGITASVAALAAVLLCACGRTDPVSSPRVAAKPVPAPQVVTAQPAAEVASTQSAKPAAADPWPPAAMQDPDPRMRRHALEQWAREPTQSLDLVAAAMVDPDESIRERAEQIFEEVLARRR